MFGRRVDVFFYGLFMDAGVLREHAVQPINPKRGYVEGLALRIGRRARLVPRPAARAYGMVYSLTQPELERLYSAPGLEEYRPEAVLVKLFEGEALPALCYNLQEEPQPEEGNAEYAARLRAVLTRLGFPPEYVASVG
jgi:hypothetical protein